MSRSSLDDADKALLEAPNFAHIVTRRKDGTPRVAVTWVDLDDDGRLRINGNLQRRWYHDLVRDPSITMTVVNLENPYQYLVVDGRLVAEGPEGADAHIDSLAKKYLHIR